MSVDGNRLVAWLARPYVENVLLLAARQLSGTPCIVSLALGLL